MIEIYLCMLVDFIHGETFGSSAVHKEGHKCRIFARSFLLGSQQKSLLNVYLSLTLHESSRIILLLLCQEMVL